MAVAVAIYHAITNMCGVGCKFERQFARGPMGESTFKFARHALAAGIGTDKLTLVELVPSPEQSWPLTAKTMR